MQNKHKKNIIIIITEEMTEEMTEIIKILIFQTDNRQDLDFLGLTKWVNKNSVEYLNNTEYQDNIFYNYEFKHMDASYYQPQNYHPAVGKINVVRELLNKNEKESDILVFLDSDAWIQNPNYLHDLIKKLLAEPNKHGCFSRDPYIDSNDYINSGSFIIKINDYTINLYNEIFAFLQQDHSHHREFRYDQYYISPKICEKKDDFLIFIPHIINTPEGQIIRHHWWKTHSMYDDLYKLVDANHHYSKPFEPFSFVETMDERPYPNPNKEDYEYTRDRYG